MAKINFQPNECIVVQEVRAAHGGVMAIYTDELMLTNFNLYCVSKGMFGNTKRTFCWPLNQIKIYNGKPQVLTGKLSNGTATLDIYFQNGCESFNFQSKNEKTINQWKKEIFSILIGDSNLGSDVFEEDDDEIDPDSPIGQVKEAWNDLKSQFGIKTTNKKKTVISAAQPESIMVNKKCISCSAPLIGKKGQMVHCKYCDTDQTI